MHFCDDIVKVMMIKMMTTMALGKNKMHGVPVAIQAVAVVIVVDVAAAVVCRLMLSLLTMLLI